jgi:hypothetical protein
MLAAREERPSVRSLLEIRRENVIVQEWDISCGAAVLTTLLRYQHGEDLTERQVAIKLFGREEYLTNPDLVQIQQGFSLLDLKRVADGLGYEGIGFGRSSFRSTLRATTTSSSSAPGSATAFCSPIRPTAIGRCPSIGSCRSGWNSPSSAR